MSFVPYNGMSRYSLNICSMKFHVFVYRDKKKEEEEPQKATVICQTTIYLYGRWAGSTGTSLLPLKQENTCLLHCFS